VDDRRCDRVVYRWQGSRCDHRRCGQPFLEQGGQAELFCQVVCLGQPGVQQHLESCHLCLVVVGTCLCVCLALAVVADDTCQAFHALPFSRCGFIAGADRPATAGAEGGRCASVVPWRGLDFRQATQAYRVGASKGHLPCAFAVFVATHALPCFFFHRLFGDCGGRGDDRFVLGLFLGGFHCFVLSVWEKVRLNF